MRGQWHGGKGPTNRVSDIKAWNSSPLWDKLGPNKKMNKEDYKLVIVCGDIHGGFSRFEKEIEKEDYKDCIIIQVGDYGIGFKDTIGAEIQTQSYVNEFLKERNIQLYVIRGNHDDPEFFNGDKRLTFSNIEFLPDYSTKIINGKKFLFVGGGISIDRKWRIEAEQNGKGKSYWEDEVFVLNYEEAVKHKDCDILITHSTPSWIGPTNKSGIATFCAADKPLWDECLEERELHNKLFEIVKPKKSFHGHFHRHERRVTDECASYILAECEFMECICDDGRMRI